MHLTRIVRRVSQMQPLPRNLQCGNPKSVRLTLRPSTSLTHQVPRTLWTLGPPSAVPTRNVHHHSSQSSLRYSHTVAGANFRTSFGLERVGKNEQFMRDSHRIPMSTKNLAKMLQPEAFSHFTMNQTDTSPQRLSVPKPHPRWRCLKLSKIPGS